MSDLYRLLPLLTLLLASAVFVVMRRLGVALTERKERRTQAEEREHARITGWIGKIRADSAGPAITRDEHGNLVLFKGLRSASRFRSGIGQHRKD